MAPSSKYTENHIHDVVSLLSYADTVLRAQEEFASLCEIVEVIKPKSTDRASLIEESKSGAFDGIKAIYRSNQTYNTAGMFDAELLDSLPKSLKFICHNGRALTSSL